MCTSINTREPGLRPITPNFIEDNHERSALIRTLESGKPTQITTQTLKEIGWVETHIPSHQTPQRRDRRTISTLTSSPNQLTTQPLLRYAISIPSRTTEILNMHQVTRHSTWLARAGIKLADVISLNKRAINNTTPTRMDVLILPLLEELLDNSSDMGIGLTSTQMVCSCLTATAEHRQHTCTRDSKLGLSPPVDPETWNQICDPASRTKEDPDPGPYRSCLCGKIFDSKEARDQHSKAKHSDDKNHGPTQTKLQ